MQKIIYFLCLGLLVTACNDGDVIDVELDFDKTLTICDLSPGSYFLYDTKKDPSESLSLIFPKNSATELIFNPTENNYKTTFPINGSNSKFNYRTYDGNPEDLLCNLLPESTTNILNDYAATSGTVTTITTFVDDDGDGIPAHIEDANLDGDNDPATNPTDTDGDGIPDYLDQDNDNVLTKDEKHNYTEANGLSNAQDTDGDGVPDYLDDDDDGDGVLTRYEDENMNGNPMDDRDESSPTPSVPRYLDKEAKDEFKYPSLRKNIYKRTITVKFYINNVNLDVISLTEINFGTYTYTIEIESE